MADIDMGIIPASAGDRKEVVRLAEELSIPSHSDGSKFITMDRLDAIQRELEGSPYAAAVRKKIFHLYAQEDIEHLNHVLLISSHADCLQPNALFEDHGDCLRGIFDNALTNAACSARRVVEYKKNEQTHGEKG